MADAMDTVQLSWYNNFPDGELKPRKITEEEGMKLLFWSGEPEKSLPHKTQILLSQQGIHVGLIEMPPGRFGPPDTHPNGHEFFVCLEGKATVLDGDNTFDLNPGEGGYCPPGTVHRLYNFTDKFCKVLFVIGGDMV